MNNKIKTSIICLRISSISYLIIGVLFLFFSSEDSLLKFLTILICAILFFFIEKVIIGLKNNQRWAWISGIILFAIYLPSLFIVLGILGLVNLLKPEVSEIFSKKSAEKSIQ